MVDRVLSSFGREHNQRIQEFCRTLVSGTLQEHASDDNVEIASEWCLRRFREHRFRETDAANVQNSMRQLVDKLTVHSQTEAAQYLHDQVIAFQRCRLNQDHTADAHAGVLRALLSLAWQPTRVPARIVRSLKAICDGRRSRLAHRVRTHSELECDRRVLLELELRQLAQSLSQDWENAWVDSGDLEEHRHVEADPIGNLDADEAGDDGRQNLFVAQYTYQLQSGRTACLPGRQDASASCCSAGTEDKDLLNTALDSVSCRKLFGFGSEACVFRSLPRVFADALSPLAELGATMYRFKTLCSGFQMLSSSIRDGCLQQAFAHTLQHGGFDVRALVGLCEGHRTSLRAPVHDVPAVFGLCWQSWMLQLESIVDQVMRHLEEWKHLYFSLAQDGMGSVCRPPSSSADARSTMALMHFVKRYQTALAVVEQVLDDVLAAVSCSCLQSAPFLWASISAETLIKLVARAAQSERTSELCGRWLVQLWAAACQPLVEAMSQWCVTGTRHDPYCEFWLCGEDRGLASVLIPPGVLHVGRHATSFLLCHEASIAVVGPQRSKLLSGRARDALLGSVPLISLSCHIPWDLLARRGVAEPIRSMSGPSIRQYLLGIVCDRRNGLLAHLNALRFVAFLERPDVLAPLLHKLFSYANRRACGLDWAGSLAIDLNSALMECFEFQSGALPMIRRSSIQEVQQLCALHLILSVTPEPCGTATHQHVGFELFSHLSVRYTVPAPLDRILCSKSTSSYSQLMCLLLRLKFSQSLLQEIDGLPVFGRAERRRHGRVPNVPARMLLLAGRCDFLRAEMAHFLQSLERYLRVNVIAAGTSRLERNLDRLASGVQQEEVRKKRGASRDGHLDFDCQDDEDDRLRHGDEEQDILDLVARIHAEQLQQLLQDSFLGPEARTVLDDAEHLLSLVISLRSCLSTVLEEIRLEQRASPCSALLADGGVDIAQNSDRLDVRPLTQTSAIDQTVESATASVARIHREFRNGVRYFLQVLSFSVARGSAQQVTSLCLQLNFNNFFSSED